MLRTQQAVYNKTFDKGRLADFFHFSIHLNGLYQLFSEICCNWKNQATRSLQLICFCVVKFCYYVFLKKVLLNGAFDVLS